MRKSKKSGIKLWFSLDNEDNDPSLWPTINVDIEDVGLTEEQAKSIGEELDSKDCFKIHSWVTKNDNL